MPSPYVDAILRGIGATPEALGRPGEGRRGPREPDPRVPGPGPGGEGDCRTRCRETFDACREACETGAGISAGCIAKCSTTYQSCIAGCGVGDECVDHRDCPEGQRCINGICEGKGEEGECYKMGPTRPAYQDCQCGVAFPAPDGSKCPSNYTWVPRGGQGWELYEEGMKGRCECTRWMIAHDPGPGDGDGLGEFDWPPELRALYERLMQRGGEFLGRRPGFSDAAMRAMFGRDFEQIRGIGGRGREEMTDWLASQGLLGTGAGVGIPQEQAWETERRIGDLKRDLMVGQEEKIKQDLLGFTGAAGDIFGRGMGYTQLREAINAARRGEGAQALEMILRLLQTQMAGWGG